MTTAQVPFESAQEVVDVEFVFEEGLEIDANLKDLISKIFILEPSKRLTLHQIRAHPYVQLSEFDILPNSGHFDKEIMKEVSEKMGISLDVVTRSLIDLNNLNGVNAYYKMLLMMKQEKNKTSQ
jgi:hypothetical protein